MSLKPSPPGQPPQPTPPGPQPNPRPGPPPPVADVFDLLFADIAEAFARLQSPARRCHRAQTTDGPVRPPVAAGKALTPSAAAAVAPATRESTGAVVAPGAGDYSDPRRGGKDGIRAGAAPGVGPSHDPMPVPPRPRPSPGVW